MPLQATIEVAIFAALALLIDLLPGIKPIPSISISLAMVPIFIVAFRWGVKAGFLSGLTWGILQILTGDAWILTPLQAFMEYFIAFSFIGFAGLLAPMVRQAASARNRPKLIAAVLLGVLIGSIARYFWHFLAGVVFFANYAYEAGKTPILFSLTMNSITMFANFIGCSIVIIAILIMQPRLLKMSRPEEVIKKAS